MPSTYYSQKQAKKDKEAREAYKRLTLKTDRLNFMANAEVGAIYLTNLDTEEAAWYPMLGGFQLANGEDKFKSNSKAEALEKAENAKLSYKEKLTAHLAECALLQ